MKHYIQALTAMIEQRSDMVRSIKEWCAANGIQESRFIITG
ncbi:MAG: hypothetical protein ACLTW9_01545 [Enterocloster sp.]